MQIFLVSLFAVMVIILIVIFFRVNIEKLFLTIDSVMSQAEAYGSLRAFLQSPRTYRSGVQKLDSFREAAMMHSEL